MRGLALLAAAILGASFASARAATPVTTRPAAWKEQVAADWLLQDRVRGAAAPAAMTTAEDAAGGCDGVIDGKFGFHTSDDARAPQWWQVDLRATTAIGRVVVYNRADFTSRTAAMEVLLSDDGKAWRSAYKHDGKPFVGHGDGKPLVVKLEDAPTARFVRLRVRAGTYLHLDEVQVYGTADPEVNLALNRPADQSSLSQWSVPKQRPGQSSPLRTAEVVARGRKLAAELKGMGVDTASAERELAEVEAGLAEATASHRHPERSEGSPPVRKETLPSAQGDRGAEALYLRARAAVRRLALSSPLLDFDRILFTKRAPGTYSHMSDQYYSWWSRPGGGVYLLEGFRQDKPALRNLTASFPAGSFLAPDLSYDGSRVLFSYCRHYPDRAGHPNKVDKSWQPEDSFYHVFEVNLDGTGLRQVTRGKYDDLHPRYLPDGRIVFLSTRRGQFLQCGPESAARTMSEPALPDSYVRCGGGNSRPVAIYTLHTMAADGSDMKAISAFESFEWDPAVAADGRIFYARWDYVDRDNMPWMKLWSTNPDGTNPQIVYGNFTRSPHCIFDARSVPGSSKVMATASAHHCITAGSVVLLDPTLGVQDGQAPLKRLTPEVCFPEAEGWPTTYFANPYPLSETTFLAAWSGTGMINEPKNNPVNATGIYLADAHGNLELLHRDPDISSSHPIPVRPRTRPVSVAGQVQWSGKQEGRFLVQDVYAGLPGIERGSIKSVRVVAMPVKTQPQMNAPNLGVTKDDPGKCVLGEAPVEADGSAHLRVPSGVAVFFQAIDGQGRAVQTMRSLTYVQPGQTLSCVGCHEPRHEAPPASAGRPIAAMRPPSKLKAPPEGAWPMRFDKLVGPVVERNCASCHTLDAPVQAAAEVNLSTPDLAYDELLHYGKPSLFDHVRKSYYDGRSHAGLGPSHTSPLLRLLDAGHYDVKLPDADRRRLLLWMDTYAQRQGSFSDEQERMLTRFRQEMAELIEP